MDVYSTLLWHLHDEVGLSSLAHDLLAISRTAPESWVALGNCFSLQKEPDEAMRCFRRASQLEPAYAYAHTLSGHEAVSMEEYDRALAFFQTAVRIDKRHFNAWCAFPSSPSLLRRSGRSRGG
jgi:anaphase-promoting complex subunit 3